MREILFRGKHYKTGKWCYGIPFKDPVSGCEGAYYPQIIPEEHGAHRYIYREFVIDETIGQYTGLTDNNGVKIFEGDIVRVNQSNYTVIFNTLGGCAEFALKESADVDVPFSFGFDYVNVPMEVIGNIYDNPELFKEDEE